MTVLLPRDANLKLPDPALVDYYKDAENRIYWLQGEITGDDIDLVKYIIRCNNEDAKIAPYKRKPIIIGINSPGGSVEVMTSIIGAMSVSDTPIVTLNVCSAYSAAAVILASGTKGRRFAMPRTHVMFHSGYASVSGTNSQVDSAMKFYDAIEKRIYEDLCERTNFTPKIQKRIKTEDVYMDDNEALYYGVVDHIVEDISQIFKVLGMEEGKADGKSEGED